MNFENTNKTKRQPVAHGDYSLPPIGGQKFPQYLQQYSENFAVFQNLYLLHNFS
jgi:hypothetical protein